MQFRLRSLIILLGVAPPLLAMAWWTYPFWVAPLLLFVVLWTLIADWRKSPRG